MKTSFKISDQAEAAENIFLLPVYEMVFKLKEKFQTYPVETLEVFLREYRGNQIQTDYDKILINELEKFLLSKNNLNIK